MNQPLVSILMPVKNTSRYLHKCLESIQNQEEHNWELIAIDDHSTDESYQILLGFKSLDKRIKVFRNKGIGIIAALRTAFKQANGEYITRMDADDIMPSHKLRALATRLSTVGRGNVITGLVKYFSEKKLGEGYLKYEQWLNHLSKMGIIIQKYTRNVLFPRHAGWCTEMT